MSSWAWTSAGLLSALAILLLLSPRLILFASEASTERRTQLTSLESFLCVHFGILLGATAISLVLCIPSSSPISPPSSEQGLHSHPLLGPLTAASALSAFLAYNTPTVGMLSFLVFLGTGTIAGFGLWAMMFAGSSRTSKKTGADKHTSAFLFGNKASASKQKKVWKKEQREQK
ncbi:hypothetical protein JAAARDRAFT_31945 [Jaapia argillacea MUCL 33604]|uniref:Uncharacterized protein n=1 Tax=Jaapia argillacea MUCL 33604 TaxID=933084 RepID=A0A067QEE6_9AGAM|nr:hypothetical protein JAAARDRAFT_31945 [Jaapia argillacea MUCL 33604]